MIGTLVDDYKYDLKCYSFMKQYEKDRSIQLQGCFLLKCCISYSSECEKRLVGLGILDHITKISKIDKDLQIACSQLRISIRSV